MISIEEFYHAEDLGRINHDDMINLQMLHYKMNCVRSYYGDPMILTSGFRTIEKQIEIYKNLGKPAALGSQHLFGAACDISDPDGKLKRWALINYEFLEDQFLFMEDFDSTPTWLHIQIYPYSSWKPGMTHIFKP